MKNEEQRMVESLLEEHARLNNEVDEQFLKELEERIDAEEKGNVVPLPASNRNQPNRWKLGIGVAACAALGFTGYQLMRQDRHAEEIVLGNDQANQQIVESGAFSSSDPSMRGLPEEGKIQGHEIRTKGEGNILQESPPMPAPEIAPEAMSLDSERKEDGELAMQPNMTQPQEVESAPRLKSIPKPAPAKAPLSKSKKREQRGLAELGDGSSMHLGRDAQNGGVIGGGVTGDNLADKVIRKPMIQEPSDQIARDGDSERYGDLKDNSFVSPLDEKTQSSTFAIDVDTASYANLRRMITQGVGIPKNAVRIEEMVNYFDYEYKKPEGKHPFAVSVDAAVCPWNEDNKLVRIALKGKEILREEREASNIVFLLDVSGSMNNANKLPLLKESLKHLLEELNEKDTISIVVYAGASGLVLPATKMDDAGRQQVVKSLEKLGAGGSTAGGQGIKLAYKIAKENFIKDGINRVILATDGDFNVGVSDNDALTSLVKDKAKSGVYLSVLGFGNGNINDEMLESITNNGNGNYNYIDTIKEGRKVLLEDMMGTIVTIAKDVKIQVDFNPNQVKEYRLIGYANRILPNEAFHDKTADAGEIGAGHTVTALYEIVPGVAGEKNKIQEFRYRTAKKEKADESKVPAEHADELLFVKLAYKQPQQKVNDESTYLSVPLKKDEVKEMTNDFSFASAVALFGMNLRESEHHNDAGLDRVLELAEKGKGPDGKGYREEFIKLVKKLKERE